MIELVQKCICGETKNFSQSFELNGLQIKRCLNCGTLHQLIRMDHDTYLQWYQQYDSYKKQTNAVPYCERYDHDYVVSQKRINKYKQILKDKWHPPLVDLGCANGAFVDCCWHNQMPSLGIDIRNICKNSQNFMEGNLFCENFVQSVLNFCQQKFFQNRFSIATMHDVLEHVVDPKTFLLQTKKLLKKNGICIVDVPDFFHLQGLHHWKPIEHVWFFDKNQLFNLFVDVGFEISYVDYPIPGKVVFFVFVK